MKKIGLAGLGFIGGYLYDHLKGNEDVQIAAIWEPDKRKTISLEGYLVCKDLEDLGSRPLDLIVEASHADVVKDLWPKITSGADLMISSMTSLSVPEFRNTMEEEALQKAKKVYLPHAAVLGLDGLRDGRNLLDSVSITTTKHPLNLGIQDQGFKQAEIVFEGSTRDACKLFPRNVNVHAAIALAGIGFEATQSIVIADPDTTKMHHRIEVGGKGLKWNLEIESFSAGIVTGSYTPESLFQSLLTCLSDQNGFCIV